MKHKAWKIPYGRPSVPAALTGAGYSPLLSAVLALRGIEDAESARALICGDASCLHDPMLILGMAEAKRRILEAISGGETVAVYGDYDVDGITSTCLLTDYLRSRGLRCHPYIPDRNEEGYGVNCGALSTLAALGVTLVITVDCGITAVEEADFARTLGMDMVITDHHECRSGALPRAAALIDCKQPGDNYPNKELAGVGVALKLVCALEGSAEPVLGRYADLAAIGTVADVMPLIDENRYLVRRGLNAISEHPRPGIAAMFKEAGVDISRLTASTISFSLAPRLNAAGRLGRAATAARLLMCSDPAEASRLASELCELNRRRQAIENEIWREANERLEGTAPDAPIVLASEGWHQGVIGIAASRLAEQYSLPAIMICLNGDTGKGSCRSFGGFNLFEALSACSGHLIGFGGHALAAGLNIRRSELEAFRLALADYYRRNRPAPLPEVSCDLLIRDASLLSVESVRSLNLLEPYGSMNPKPVMCISGARLVSASAVGGGRHLKMRVRLGGIDFDAIFFSHTLAGEGVHEGELIDIAFTPQINEFRGVCSVQLVACALRAHDAEELCSAILARDGGAVWAASAYCPERSDFVRIWRSLRPDFSVGRDVGEIMAQCPDGMEPEKYCVCLMTLLETGLLRSGDGGIFSARPAAIAGKADLEATELIRALRAEMR